MVNGYVPRLGERSVLHRAVRENVETFLASARERSEHGFSDDDVAKDALAALSAESMAGKRRPEGDVVPRRCGRFEAFVDGFSLHCGVHLHASDRAGIERLCRCGARGPLTLGRLTQDLGVDV